MAEKRGRAIRFERGGAVAGILALMVALAGCAATPAGAPRVMQADDFKMLAGEWIGATNVQNTTSIAVRGVIQDTGAYYLVPRTGTPTQQPGQMKIVDGGVVYESPTSKGKMTFHESQDGKGWVWKWDGVTPDGRPVKNELTKSK
jgi:hypothetical protein